MNKYLYAGCSINADALLLHLMADLQQVRLEVLETYQRHSARGHRPEQVDSVTRIEPSQALCLVYSEYCCSQLSFTIFWLIGLRLYLHSRT